MSKLVMTLEGKQRMGKQRSSRWKDSAVLRVLSPKKSSLKCRSMRCANQMQGSAFRMKQRVFLFTSSLVLDIQKNQHDALLDCLYKFV